MNCFACNDYLVYLNILKENSKYVKFANVVEIFKEVMK